MQRLTTLLILISLAACEGTATTPANDDVGGDSGSAENNATADMKQTPDATPDMVRNGDVGSAEDATSDGSIDMSNLIGSAGCNVGAGIPEGENTLTIQNRNRRYIVRLPNNYTNTRPWPLVFALHGNGGSAAYWDATQGPQNVRGVLQDDAILIIAEAIEGNWRDYNADPSTWPARIEEELEYFDTIMTRAKDDFCINEDAIFSIGFSGGGSFSGVLGCRRTDIRAIAVGGSVIYFDEANCVGTHASWIEIGAQDQAAGRTAYLDYFRARAGCDATSTATTPATCIAYDNCPAAYPVHYCEPDVGHVWPDYGSVAMWDFFQAVMATDQ